MKRSLVIALAACAVAAPASACGPDFPEQLLADRAATLSQLPEGHFYDEAARLVPVPQPAFKPVERDEWQPVKGPTRESIEQQLLGADYARALEIRQRVSAAVAYAAGAGLPEEARRYLAGAAAFAHDDREEAQHRFTSVLELPPAERTHYGVWAAYMLGRSMGDTDEAGAARAFGQVRTLVAAGAPDPLGLAADSYGEEAHVKLDAGDDAAAIALYAQQAALGSRVGWTSLLHIARALIADPARLDRSIADPLTQRLIAAYLLTRSGELDSEYEDASTASASAATAMITRFLDAVDQRGIDHVEDADRLAALAYRSGRYDIAARFAAKGGGGLAAWVRAKLALREGDANAAAAAYAEAAKAFPITPPQPRDEDVHATPSSYCRVQGEAGTLALLRGEYMAALDHLYAAAPDYWLDAAWVAERVLTMDELKTFVEAHANQALPPPAQTDDSQGYDDPPALRLRSLFARRLLRAERYDEALGYFDDPKLKAQATAYAAARRGATAGGQIERARHGYAAGRIARADGLDLLGYELDPDYQTFGGGYDLGKYDDPPVDPDAPKPPPPPALKIATVAQPGERERTAATVARPDQRFHYRYVAAELAAQAAEQVPQRSQAYAALLCQAAGYLIWRDPPAAGVYYARYVKFGPHVEWAGNFGHQCEEPDFDGAAARLHAERVAAAKRLARKALPYVLGGGLLVFAAGVLAWRRRRAGKPTTA
ncbi:MAG TPA: hypothetical protein VGC55_16640 [Dokdonella sp.]